MRPTSELTTRRGLLQAGAVLTVGATMTACVPKADSPGQDVVAFHGIHQAGIQTPKQSQLTLMGCNLSAGASKEDLGRLMWVWSDDAARLTSGRPALADTEPELAKYPANLTITFGIGPELSKWVPGLKLTPLPAFRTDKLDDRWGQTDLVVQIAGDDPLVVAHAQRMLGKDMAGLAHLKWIQSGFHQVNPNGGSGRNLMGQLDGSVNPRNANEHDTLVWAPAPWRHGTFLVVRRIEMNLDSWDELDREAREFSIGRRLDNGAPLSGGKDEFAQPDLTRVDGYGFPRIDPASHVARSRGAMNGPQFLRRGYNYLNHEDGTSGLIFMAYAADLPGQFIPVQQRLAEQDLLNQWTTAIGSAVYAIWPGTAPGGYLGQAQLGLA
jgi:dye decolorizing peroxidase